MIIVAIIGILSAGGVPADAGTMMGQGIGEWRCGPASSNAVATKHLPSSCRGA
jgi:hypothetical protein